MSATTLAALIERLPPGRARARYERLLAETGGEMLSVRLRYAQEPLWLVSGPRQVKVLTGRGIPRWRVWTLQEVKSVLDACGSVVGSVSSGRSYFPSQRAGSSAIAIS
jgi:hypothetical protein